MLKMPSPDKRVAVIGLDPAESDALKARVGDGVRWLVHSMLPRLKVVEGALWVEREDYFGFARVDAVVFHGIFENDFDPIVGLALWGGPCFPNARAMMDLRLKLPGLIRVLDVTSYGQTLRGFVLSGDRAESSWPSVAKWGNWHCGENKARFNGTFHAQEPSWLEPFFDGEAVRIVSIGTQSWQVRLAGDGWMKSIHGEGAEFMEVDADLLADTRRIMDEFGLNLVGVDYIVSPTGQKHLLEVNHIPSVTCFSEIRETYLDDVARWIRSTLVDLKESA